MSPRRFRLMLLGIFAAAAALAAEGVQTFAEMRERHFMILARQEAAAPVAYWAALPTLHALAPAAEGGVRAFVRADSAGAQGEALCALAATTAGAAEVRWVALSPAVDGCVAERIGTRMLRAGAPAAAEFGRARWVAVDADGRGLYAQRDAPSAAHLRGTMDILAPRSDGASAIRPEGEG